MREKLARAAALLLILAAALALRLPHLGDRPLHGDEAVHAVKFRELWEKGRYEYDPDEYHGPTLYYAALPVVAARGRATFAETEESDYRLAVALLGAAMVLLYPLLRDGLGSSGALWAALFTAVSAPWVFYSRYFIQEMVLAGLTLALIACGWRYRVSGRTAWLMAAAVSAGLMIATKETAILTFAALGLASFSMRGLRNPQSEVRLPSPQSAIWNPQFVLAVLLALAVAFVFLSGFFSHVRGPLSYWETYAPWLRRAGGTDLHRHPWHYYLSLLAWQRPGEGPVWTELFLFGLAAVGALMALSRKILERVGAHPAFARGALVYTLVLTAIYSGIPYKTPWNLLSFYLGFVLLAGLGAGALLSLPRSLPLKVLAGLLLLAGAGHLAWQSGRTTFHYRDDHTGPYVYAQPLRGVREIEQRVNELAAFSPQKEQTVAQVLFQDAYYWPLPWSLRRLQHVGYWTGAVPREEEARLRGTPILLSSAEWDAELTERLGDSHFMVGFYSLRPGVLVQMWVKNELWEPFVMSRPRNAAPDE